MIRSRFFQPRLGRWLTIFVLFLGGFSQSALAKIPDLTGLSEKWRQFVDLDWNYNVPWRPVMPRDERSVKTVYQVNFRKIFGAPERKFFEECLIQEMCTMSENDIAYMIAPKDWKPSASLLSKGVLTPTQLKAVKLQSWTTHLVWDSSDPEQQNSTPFFLKTQGWDGEIAIDFTRYLRKAFVDEREDLLDFFSEPVAIKGQISYNLRLEQSYRFLRDYQKKKLYKPVHGYVEYLVQTANDPEKVFAEIMPLLGTAMARLHLKYGIYHRSHTQNLVLQMNASGTKFEKLIIRDLRDSNPDPLVVDSQQHDDLVDLLLQNPRLEPFGKAVFDDLDKNRSVGFFLDTYLGQSVTSIFNFQPESEENLPWRFWAWKSLAIFLLNYIEEAERLTGEKISLEKGSDIGKTIEFLTKIVATSPLDSLPELVTNFVNENDFMYDRDIIGGYPAQDFRRWIYGHITGKFRLILANRHQFKKKLYNQRILRRHFKRAFGNRTVTTLRPFELEKALRPKVWRTEFLKKNRKYDLYYDQGRIFLVNRKTNRTLAIAYVTDEKAKESILKSEVSEEHFSNSIFGNSLQGAKEKLESFRQQCQGILSPTGIED